MSDLFHTGATVFIRGQAFLLGAFVAELPGWELLQDGQPIMIVPARQLRNLVDGVKFAVAA